MILWLGEHADDVEADFLILYKIKDPWSVPSNRFLPMATRLFFYQGALQYRALEEQEEGEGSSGYMSRSNRHQMTRNGVDMRHNMVAAKAAARSVKGGDDEVKVVPVAQWMAMAPPGTVEYEQAKA